MNQASAPAHVTRPNRGGAAAAAWFCSIVALTATETHAVTLTNNDRSTYKIEVIAKSMRRAHELAPGKSLVGFCLDGCIVRLNESADNDYELEGSERVSIEGGLVYYDGEEAKPEPGPQESDNEQPRK